MIHSKSVIVLMTVPLSFVNDNFAKQQLIDKAKEHNEFKRYDWGNNGHTVSFDCGKPNSFDFSNVNLHIGNQIDSFTDVNDKRFED